MPDQARPPASVGWRGGVGRRAVMPRHPVPRAGHLGCPVWPPGRGLGLDALCGSVWPAIAPFIIKNHDSDANYERLVRFQRTSRSPKYVPL